ncbi:nucleotide exchange factor GrpE [Blochmannia endosymbiont of Camponotus (Colobopsis) obliquus]|uniref:nucleotide exchange factor GrpE n=1 Tax=Blochmannia endosymbiont of Camponotus (Colobopsis) obliquus TaxID=1505597 RepID=UPI00061ABE32|nr:nucleotide exchange factor GrpE [Blochmannia endosymbiont of Camponotus (Colobopsis) obliquus]
MTNKEQNTPDNQVSQSNVVEEKNQDVKQETCQSVHDVLDSRDEKIIKLETELLQMQQRERDTLLRVTAEMENIRRRSEQNIEKAHKFALEHFISELLPVIDNLERTLEMLNKSDNNFEAITTGVELTHKSFLDIMYKFGLEVISEVNVPFNPEIHQAMTISESDEYDSNQVIMVVQKGYRLNARLVRPAMVIVSKIKSI